MASDFPGMKFAKFNCGTNDKKFSIAKKIKALPTFHIYHNTEKVGQFVGANARELRKYIQQFAQ